MHAVLCDDGLHYRAAARCEIAVTDGSAHGQ
jgi:hypothetical protein